MNKTIKIAIAEPSEVICAGIISILKKTGNIEPFPITDIKQLKYLLGRQHYDVLIVNPLITGFASLLQIKNEAINSRMKFLALRTVLCDNSHFSDYDEVLSIYDTSEQIRNKLTKIILSPEAEKPNNTLSDREKEIVSYVVKGMPNKQIADKLNLSIHTVVTHRRNIANKLDIHSTSGLTIYAIVNKLVEIDNLDDK